MSGRKRQAEYEHVSYNFSNAGILYLFRDTTPYIVLQPDTVDSMHTAWYSMGDYGQDIQHLRFSSYPIVPLSAAMHESLSLLFLFRHSSNPIRPFLPLSLTGDPPPPSLCLSFLRPSHSHRRTDRDGEKKPRSTNGESALSLLLFLLSLSVPSPFRL